MKKPNILVITTDEQHRETLESFGAKALKMPHEMMNLWGNPDYAQWKES